MKALDFSPPSLRQVKAMVAALPQLKALWLNGNGVARVLDTDATLQSRLEILNRKVTRAYSEWALRYLATNPEGEGEEEQVGGWIGQWGGSIGRQAP